MRGQKIGWVIDYPIKGSGGHKTWFYYINALVELGYDVDVYVNNPSGNSNTELHQIVNDYLIPTKANIIPGWEIKGKYKMLFATWYPTAKLVASYPFVEYKLYFVQDYEPYFNPYGDEYMIAKISYELGLIGVTMGNWLARKLNKEHGMQTYPLFLGADTKTYYPQNKIRTNQACFLYQPEKPRRLNTLTKDTIEILHQIEPSVKIITYGSFYGTDLPYVEHKGLLSIDELAKLYNTSLVGINFSSTNPSRNPFEMMACGLPVVEIFGENNIYDLPEEAVLMTKYSPEHIAGSIQKLLNSPELWQKLHSGGLKFMEGKSLDTSVKEFLKLVETFTSDGSVATKQPRKLYLQDPEPVNLEEIHSKLEFNKNIFTEIKQLPDKSHAFRIKGTIKTKLKNLLRKIKRTNYEFSFAVNIFVLNLSNIINTLKLKLVLRKRFALFSSDVFDTLVRRKVAADEVKLKTAYYFYLKQHNYLKHTNPEQLFKQRQNIEFELGRASEATNNDHEYEIHDVIKAWVEYYIPVTDVNTAEIAAELVNYEINFEKQIVYYDEKGVEFYNKVKAEEKVLLSDFYMTQADLNKATGLPYQLKQIDKTLVSGENKLNKISGNAYTHLLNLYPNARTSYLHIGDNKNVDYVSARNKGVNAYLFSNPKHDIHKLKLNKLFAQRNRVDFVYANIIQNGLSKIKQPKGLSRKQKQLFKRGKELAPVFFFYVLSIIETAIQEKADKVYYFTREGIFFKQIHDEIAKLKLFDFKIPDSEILEVSRVATFAPSLNEFNVDELKRVWNQYEKQSGKALFKTLNLPFAEFAEFFKKYEIDPELEKIIWQDADYLKLFADKKFINKVNKLLNDKKVLLLKYLTQKGFTSPGGKIVISDIGWRATIHDNLARLLPKVNIVGVYLGLLQPLNYQPRNTYKKAFGPFFAVDNEYYTALLDGGASLLEMLSNAPGGSTVGYKHGDKVTAIKEIKNEEDEINYEQYIKYFQQGVLASLPFLTAFTKSHAIASWEARSFAVELIEKVIKNPPNIIAEAFFNRVYSETFGVGTYFNMNKRSKISIIDLLLAPVSFNRRKKVLEKSKETHWLYGFWKYNDPTGVLNALFRLYTFLKPNKDKLFKKLNKLWKK